MEHIKNDPRNYPKASDLILSLISRNGALARTQLTDKSHLAEDSVNMKLPLEFRQGTRLLGFFQVVFQNNIT